jgi:hypothetical protein
MILSTIQPWNRTVERIGLSFDEEITHRSNDEDIDYYSSETKNEPKGWEPNIKNAVFPNVYPSNLIAFILL